MMEFVYGFLVGYILTCWVWAWVATDDPRIPLHIRLVVTIGWPLFWPIIISLQE